MTFPLISSASAPLIIALPPSSPAHGPSSTCPQGKSPQKPSPRLSALLEQHPKIDGSLLHSQVMGGAFTTPTGKVIEFAPLCDVNEEDAEGKTAMDVALEKGNITALSVLQKSGAHFGSHQSPQGSQEKKS